MANAPFPLIAAPFVDESRQITRPWVQLLQVLWTRTGGAIAGVVTEIDTGSGLSGGPIIGTGTIRLANQATATILANFSGGAAAASPTTLTLVLDSLSAIRGAILFRGAATWGALAATTAGKKLQTNGAISDPTWEWPFTVTTAITAAGINQITATLLTTDLNQVTTTAAGTGVRIGALAPGQNPCIVTNRGANALNVYPPTGAAIDGLAANAPFVLGVNAIAEFWCFSAVQFYSK